MAPAALSASEVPIAPPASEDHAPRARRTPTRPSVDCWVHLPAHITEREIPDPLAFAHECRAL